MHLSIPLDLFDVHRNDRELIVNNNLSDDTISASKVKSSSCRASSDHDDVQVVTVKEDGSYLQEDYVWSDVGPLANLYLSEGKKGKV